uniref:Uncharacterized protein n=1 Tax=Rhizochromulina marina TaxID=1034831 RepID=A0A7S2RS17_9STRA
MAALVRPKTANYTVSDSFLVDTADNEDHTFSGVMFTIECRKELPLDLVEIYSISVRGALGPLTVWVTPDSWRGKHEDESAWSKVYERTHNPSYREFVELKFSAPVVVESGKSIGVYVHSRRPDDEAIVYDDQHSRVTHQDRFITIGPGLAHLCDEPFSSWHPWGAWRQRRQFVGQVSYGAKYTLWNPEVHQNFPVAFRHLARLLLFIKQQPDCPISRCSNDILFYILNMCRWDWVPVPESLQSAAQLEEARNGPAAEPDEDDSESWWASRRHRRHFWVHPDMLDSGSEELEVDSEDSDGAWVPDEEEEESAGDKSGSEEGSEAEAMPTLPAASLGAFRSLMGLLSQTQDPEEAASILGAVEELFATSVVEDGSGEEASDEEDSTSVHGYQRLRSDQDEDQQAASQSGGSGRPHVEAWGPDQEDDGFSAMAAEAPAANGPAEEEEDHPSGSQPRPSKRVRAHVPPAERYRSMQDEGGGDE